MLTAIFPHLSHGIAISKWRYTVIPRWEYKFHKWRSYFHRFLEATDDDRWKFLGHYLELTAVVAVIDVHPGRPTHSLRVPTGPCRNSSMLFLQVLMEWQIYAVLQGVARTRWLLSYSELSGEPGPSHPSFHSVIHPFFLLLYPLEPAGVDTTCSGK